MKTPATYQEVEKMADIMNKFYSNALKPYFDMERIQANGNVSVKPLKAKDSYNQQNTILLQVTLGGATYGIAVIDDDFDIHSWVHDDKLIQRITMVDIINNILNPEDMVIGSFGRTENMQDEDDVYNAVTTLYSMQEVINKYDNFNAIATGMKDREMNAGITPEEYKGVVNNMTKLLDMVAQSLQSHVDDYTPEMIQDFIDYTGNLTDKEKMILNNQLAYAQSLFQITEEPTYMHPANYLNTLIFYSWDFMKFQLDNGHKTFSEIAEENGNFSN